MHWKGEGVEGEVDEEGQREGEGGGEREREREKTTMISIILGHHHRVPLIQTLPCPSLQQIFSSLCPKLPWPSLPPCEKPETNSTHVCKIMCYLKTKKLITHQDIT